MDHNNNFKFDIFGSSCTIEFVDECFVLRYRGYVIHDFTFNLNGIESLEKKHIFNYLNSRGYLN